MYLVDIPNARRGTIIDVRSSEEFLLGHAHRSVNIPWDMHMYYLTELAELPRPWIFVCNVGWRSGLVIHSLETIGFSDLYNGGSWLSVLQQQEAMGDTLEPLTEL
jgi:phage shock protein E